MLWGALELLMRRLMSDDLPNALRKRQLYVQRRLVYQKPLQIDREVARVLVAIFLAFLQAFHANLAQVRMHFGNFTR